MPSFSTIQLWYERTGHFFVLGAEHLLSGADHILFLLALVDELVDELARGKEMESILRGGARAGR